MWGKENRLKKGSGISILLITIINMVLDKIEFYLNKMLLQYKAEIRLQTGLFNQLTIITSKPTTEMSNLSISCKLL